jgi:methionyl-tRNA synthetase
VDVFIGVAWPYASGPRHLGHLAGAYLPADVAAATTGWPATGC